MSFFSFGAKYLNEKYFPGSARQTRLESNAHPVLTQSLNHLQYTNMMPQWDDFYI